MKGLDPRRLGRRARAQIAAALDPATLRPTRKRSKYGNVRVTVDGITFDSKAEANRWLQLQMLQARGLISDLYRQVAFPLVVNGTKVCDYVADFIYIENRRLVVEDVKCEATRTPVYRLKKRLLKALRNIDIVEIEA